MPVRKNADRAKKILHRARTLRQIQTDAEKLFWSRVRARQLEGYKFKRQAPIGNYVVDFVCPDAALIIELDGGQHALQNDQDKVRTAKLMEAGYRVLRFWNNDVLSNIDGVLETVLAALKGTPSP